MSQNFIGVIATHQRGKRFVRRFREHTKLRGGEQHGEAIVDVVDVVGCRGDGAGSRLCFGRERDHAIEAVSYHQAMSLRKIERA